MSAPLRAMAAAAAALGVAACGGGPTLPASSRGTLGDATGPAGTSSAAGLALGAGRPTIGAAASVSGGPLNAPGTGRSGALPGGAAVDAPPGAVATPESSAGSATVTTTGGTFVITGSTCRQAGDSAAFLFGVTGSGEEVEVSIQHGYRGAGTYGSSDTGVAVTVGHAGRAWYAQYASDAGASLTINPGERAGTFSFDTQIGNPDHVTGRFTCG